MTSIPIPPNIEILPEHIIDQIKAGEVLERPAALLKELIENSIDAKATDIQIHLVENGMDLISIEDNGHGMSFKNLPLAFLRHATSKISRYEDIYRLLTFGFRGEALASLASCARVTCTSQPADLEHEGGKIIMNGGATELLIPWKGTHQGTSLFIKDLFFNTPARLKFIKSKTSEKSALKKMIYSFVLANPKINFSIRWDDKEKEVFKAEEDLNRVREVFFPKQAESVFHAISEYERYKVNVYFTPKTYSTPQYRHHYLFTNNRFFQDKTLHQAVLRNLDNFWRFGESGHYMIKIDSPPEEIDVNVHPNKTQIKFLKSDIIYSLIVSAIKNAIKEHHALNTSTEKPHHIQSFFSRDENQNFDLEHFSAKDTTISMSANQYSPGLNLPSDAPINLERLSEQFFIINKDHQYYIADLKWILIDYFTLRFKTFSSHSEEQASPLLISEPFKMAKGKIDSCFEELKLVGFEFDRLNAEYVALRTTPRFLPQSLLISMANIMLNYFSDEKNSAFNEKTFSTKFSQELNNDFLLEVPSSLIFELVQDLNSKHIIELTNDRIKKLFNHE